MFETAVDFTTFIPSIYIQNKACETVACQIGWSQVPCRGKGVLRWQAPDGGHGRVIPRSSNLRSVFVHVAKTRKLTVRGRHGRNWDGDSMRRNESAIFGRPSWMRRESGGARRGTGVAVKRERCVLNTIGDGQGQARFEEIRVQHATPMGDVFPAGGHPGRGLSVRKEAALQW